jgi:hypothetical protein
MAGTTYCLLARLQLAIPLRCPFELKAAEVKANDQKQAYTDFWNALSG